MVEVLTEEEETDSSISAASVHLSPTFWRCARESDADIEKPLRDNPIVPASSSADGEPLQAGSTFLPNAF